MVLGLDGSAHSRRAAAFLTRLAPGRAGRVLCVQVVEPTRVPSAPLLAPSMRGRLAREAAALHGARVEIARRQIRVAAARLARAGWRARGDVRIGLPVAELLAAARSIRADLVVLGARGAGAITRLLLGSVAESVLRQSPVPVLIVK